MKIAMSHYPEPHVRRNAPYKTIETSTHIHTTYTQRTKSEGKTKSVNVSSPTTAKPHKERAAFQ